MWLAVTKVSRGERAGGRVVSFELWGPRYSSAPQICECVMCAAWYLDVCNVVPFSMKIG